jgi:predicted glycogen debranching enzyme
MALTLGQAELLPFENGAGREWLSANGTGSFASGSVAGANTRRYHGLLVAALAPPLGRMTLLAKLDESVSVHGERFDFSTNRYPDGVIYPDGWRHVESFTSWPVPTWTLRCGSGEKNDTVVTKRVFLARGKNTVYVSYTLVAAPAPVQITLTPLVAWKDYHALMHPWPDFPHAQGASDHGWRVQATPDAPVLRLIAPSATWSAAGWWHERVTLEREIERGFPGEEDLYCPALATLTLSRPGQSAAFVATIEDDEPEEAPRVLDEIARHQDALVRAAGRVAENETGRDLVCAADQFVVRMPESDGAKKRTTILAGYPWFTDWGRDTMIALPGLCLTTGRADMAREILESFAGVVSEGMIPNRFPDQGETPDYNTADATLWFVHACDRYVAATGDAAFRSRWLPTLKAILADHAWGTRYNIHVDPADGLLYAFAPGAQLTWMDAKVGNWVVTPRGGKPVEINALFLNALCVAADWSRAAGETGDASAYDALAERARSAFLSRFVRPDGRGLFDVINTNDTADATIRPNQIIAAALPYSPLNDDQVRAVVETVQAELLTPYGLRTLSPHDPAYRPRYEGGPAERDGAYHQGTVWPWLLGPFVDAFRRVHGNNEATNVAVRDLLAPLVASLSDYGVGGIAEVYDAEPAQRANGCPWQAWSVAEVLRAWSSTCVPVP